MDENLAETQMKYVISFEETIVFIHFDGWLAHLAPEFLKILVQYCVKKGWNKIVKIWYSYDIIITGNPIHVTAEVNNIEYLYHRRQGTLRRISTAKVNFIA